MHSNFRTAPNHLYSQVNARQVSQVAVEGVSQENQVVFPERHRDLSPGEVETTDNKQANQPDLTQGRFFLNLIK